jgi:hypothetical protein
MTPPEVQPQPVADWKLHELRMEIEPGGRIGFAAHVIRLPLHRIASPAANVHHMAI